MNCRHRPYGSKTTIAFWMLVAIADAAMLIATAGVLVMFLILAGLALAAGGVVAARLLTRRDAAATKPVARRRA
jgi:apolipoprotein N-acyltransferase